MVDVICFCGFSYSFSGDRAVCPNCGDVTVAPASVDRRQEPRSETALAKAGLMAPQARTEPAHANAPGAGASEREAVLASRSQ